MEAGRSGVQSHLQLQSQFKASLSSVNPALPLLCSKKKNPKWKNVSINSISKYLRWSTRSASGAYRGCLHQVLIVIPVISKHIFSESCRMACAIIWLRPSKQESAACERRNKRQQHMRILHTSHMRTGAKMSSVGHSPSQGTSGDSGRWVLVVPTWSGIL